MYNDNRYQGKSLIHFPQARVALTTLAFYFTKFLNACQQKLLNLF